MAILGVANLRFGYGDHIVLDGTNMTLDHGEHVGMVGRNGQGKSTLMKLIAGLNNMKPDEGQIQLARGSTVGYLHQDPKLNLERTLREEAQSVFEELEKLHEELDVISHQMAEVEGDELDKLLKRYEQVEHLMQAAGGYAVDHQIEQALHGLGLGDETFNVKVKDLSGGQRGRLALAKLLLAKPDLLLLDEPTNHLDIVGRIWLEEYLTSYPGAVILISHDRWLLDRVVSKIYEVEIGRVFEYPGNYHKFTELRAERRMVAQRVYEKQQDKIRQEKNFIDRYKAGQRAKQARGREGRLERYIANELTERPIELNVMNLQLPAPPRSGDQVLLAENLCKAYEDGTKPLFQHLNVIVRRGDRIGIIGPNGSGKSTLVRCMLGEQDADSGECRLGSQVLVGHFKQVHDDMLPEHSILEYLTRRMPNENGQLAREMAGAFLFTGDEQEKKLGTLSGGERSRVALAAMIAGTHNLLVLDEPTNHLDVLSAERLEEAAKLFTAEPTGWGEQSRGGGTLILISHDRWLLDALVNQLLILDGHGGVKHFWGNYSQYVEAQNVKVKEAATKADEEAKRAAANKPKSAPAPKQQEKKPENQGKKSDQQSKKQQPQRGGALSKMSQAKLEARIMEIETELAELDTKLAEPDTYKNHKLFTELQNKHEKLTKELGPLEEEWTARGE
jgi:ATP-binding cassette subfamily F protein 3